MIRVRVEIETDGQYTSSERRGDDVVRELLFALGAMAEDLKSPRLLEVVEAAWSPVLRNPQERS